MYTEPGWLKKKHLTIHAYDPILCQAHQCEGLITMEDKAFEKALEKAFHDAVRLCVYRLTEKTVSEAFIKRNFKDWLFGTYDECDGL